jgi:hypothetical protein
MKNKKTVIRYPELPPEAVAAENEIFLAIGSALDSWMKVEQHLAHVFSICMNSENSLPAHKAYWAVFSFQSRLDMVHAAVQVRLFHEEQLLGQWNSMYNRLTRRAKKRNKVAHGCLQPARGERRKGAKPYWSPFHWSYMIATLPARQGEHDQHFPGGYPKGRLFVPDIQSIQETFDQDADDVSALGQALRPIVQREESDLQGVAKSHRRAVAGLRAARIPKGR